MSVALRCPVDVPRSLDEALQALRDATERTVLLAGGTDLMVEFDNGRTRPDRVVCIREVNELHGIVDSADGLQLGALSSCAELASSASVKAEADILALAADEVGAEQIKNQATLGGNLGTASPAADLNPVLFALDARVGLVSLEGRRELPVADFITGYRSTARRSDELIETIRIPRRPPGERRAFRKVGTRRRQSISKVVVALALSCEDGQVQRVRGAAGSVSPATVMLPSLAKELEGRAPTPDRILAASRAAARHDCAPVDDVRSTATYRRLTLQRLLKTLVEELANGSR